jgi:endoglycosylceramidase
MQRLFLPPMSRLRHAGAFCILLCIGACSSGGESSKDASTSDASAPTCTVSLPTPPDWRLVAHGATLEDGFGRTVFLRGVDAGGRSKFAPYVPFDFDAGEYSSALETYMSRAESWGIDAMRVPFTWAALEPTAGATNEAWVTMYAELLASAWAHGIYAVVDFHQDVYSEVYCGDGFPGWTVASPPAPAHDCPMWELEYFGDAQVEAAFDAFWGNTTGLYPKYLAAWDTMIARFVDTPGVVGFEVINEPASGTESEGSFESTTLTAFYTKVASHMRAEAPRSLVFVDPPGLDGVSATTQLRNPGVDGVVFAPHYYPLGGGSLASVVMGLTNWAKVGAAWNVPVFLGEFGASDTLSSTPAYIASVFEAADELGLAGAIEWEYSVSKELWNSETDTVVASDGTEYPVAASLIRPYARAVAGSNIRQSWSASTKTFALSYSPTGATTDVSELRVPSRAYPSGLSVSIQGGCYDATSVAGEVLVRPLAGAKQVTLTIKAQ